MPTAACGPGWRWRLACRCWPVAPLCTKHLYLFRETPPKQPPAQRALVVTDPTLVQAVMPGANLNLQGAQWAPLQPSSHRDYRLPSREWTARRFTRACVWITCRSTPWNCSRGAAGWRCGLDLLSPAGQEKFTDTVQLDLQAGQAYFLRPDWQELLNKRLVIKAEPLPEAYTPLLRARVIDRQRQTEKSASLD